MLTTRCLRLAALRRPAPCVRRLSTSPSLRYANEAPASPAPTAAAAAAAGPVSEPVAQTVKPGISVCPEGTILTGLNYFKGSEDPVAMKDEDYPEWLWSCLDVIEKKAADGKDDGANEFSKSKKERRRALKQSKAAEERLRASGDPEAFAPKIPIQHQSINLPGREGGTIEENIAAAETRDELKRAMHAERKAKIKESNYLKSM